MINRIPTFHQFCGLDFMVVAAQNHWMKRLIPLICFLFVAQTSGAQEVIPTGARCLIEAYPDVVCGFRDNHVIFCDKTTMVYDDGRAKSAQQAIDDPDLEDHFKFPYPETFSTPPFESDPGRVRYDPFFEKVYGASKKDVAKTVKETNWFGGSVRLTNKQKVRSRFEAARAEVEALPKKTRDQVKKPSGGFVWRTIKGTKRRSAHSYGIAVDVGVTNSDYWKWNKPIDGKYPYKNRIPHEVVEIFERHGFIWGGKWYHYDTMHFEYRPEILCKKQP